MVSLGTNNPKITVRNICYYFNSLGGVDVLNFEPNWLKFKVLDKSIKELRAMFKVHPEWFEVPKPKSVAGKNEVDYSIK